MRKCYEAVRKAPEVEGGRIMFEKIKNNMFVIIVVGAFVIVGAVYSFEMARVDYEMHSVR